MFIKACKPVFTVIGQQAYLKPHSLQAIQQVRGLYRRTADIMRRQGIVDVENKR